MVEFFFKTIHRTFWEIEMAKNIQSISRLLRERPHSGLWNEPPLDSLDPQSPNPFMASPSPDPIQRLAIKGFRDWGSRLSSGGSFRSPEWGRSRSSLEIDWIFFCHFNFQESAVLWADKSYSWEKVSHFHNSTSVMNWKVMIEASFVKTKAEMAMFHSF